MPVSGNGRSPVTVTTPGGGAIPGNVAPLYGRGRSSRDHWKRNSFDSEGEMIDDKLPLTAWEKSFSKPLALSSHESTSNVPFSCWDQL